MTSTEGNVCRVCLRCIVGESTSLFSKWRPRSFTANDVVSIGERLAQLADVQMLEGDGYPQRICDGCLATFEQTLLLLRNARRSDRLLRCGRSYRATRAGPRLPGPIRFDPAAVGAAPAARPSRKRARQADKTAGPAEVKDNEGTEAVRIKEEVVSEEESAEGPERAPDFKCELDIKIEPEELVQQYHGTGHIAGVGETESQVLTNFVISSTYSVGLSGLPIDTGGGEASHVVAVVKEEMDEDTEGDVDVPLDCMLCHKAFTTLTGLKAHVIASHSYKSVHRKRINGRVETAPDEERCRSGVIQTSRKHSCFACSKSFSTIQSLSIHEKVHSTDCPHCSECFSSFVLLAHHQRVCGPSGRRAGEDTGTREAIGTRSKTKTVRQLKREMTAEPLAKRVKKKKRRSQSVDAEKSADSMLALKRKNTVTNNNKKRVLTDTSKPISDKVIEISVNDENVRTKPLITNFANESNAISKQCNNTHVPLKSTSTEQIDSLGEQQLPSSAEEDKTIDLKSIDTVEEQNYTIKKELSTEAQVDEVTDKPNTIVNNSGTNTGECYSKFTKFENTHVSKSDESAKALEHPETDVNSAENDFENVNLSPSLNKAIAKNQERPKLCVAMNKPIVVNDTDALHTDSNGLVIDVSPKVDVV